MSSAYQIKRREAACAQFGISNSGFYEWIARGLMTPGVKLSWRSVGWPASELEAIAAARIAGKSEAEIKTLVQSLLAARRNAGCQPTAEKACDEAA